ncbi:MAG: patatin family protein [Oscillospiraceae bacterium]|jgi:predicted patatin/cPLA2 family phospholipase|nr:patatin family protein [Oscillospiraceae bacterium]MDD3260833.1 patatin family protein [Oscillospiraceae bacterium]
MPTGLVLEGGGLRGVYTAGVLDEFMKNKISFPSVYAVSAGACCSLSYLSGQYERNKDIFYHYVPDDRYVSFKNMRETGSLFGFNFIFGELFHKLNPFDYEAFRKSSVRLMIGVTDLLTGKEAYFTNSDMDENFLPVQASSSLPFWSPIVWINGRPYMDGGLAAPVPYERSIQDGNGRNVVVLTRDLSYRKRFAPDYPRGMIHVHYRDYPNFVKTLERRGYLYNRQMAFIRQQERAGNMVVIRPSSPINLGRCEKDAQKLLKVYYLGRRDAAARISAVKALTAKK